MVFYISDRRSGGSEIPPLLLFLYLSGEAGLDSGPNCSVESVESGEKRKVLIEEGKVLS